MNTPQDFSGLRTGRLLEGRTVVISGAARARGIGKATARLFVAHGARVAMLDLDEAEVRQSAADVAQDGGPTIGIRCDVTDKASCDRAIAQVLAWDGSQGRIDVLVNNAGITQKRKVAEITEADYELVTNVVLRGTILLSQAVLPAMQARQSGSIVSVSSMSALQGGGVFGGPHYCAAKAGVLGFTRSLALELGPQGIRANAVTPGLIVTDFSRTNRSDEEKDASAQGWPMRRAGRPVELASACLFLASDLSSYVTGITLDVNGGAYMR
jgi:NAD(P)-dependent dehydrogenase (short-subunit alcohol dehydrogenase family)